MLIKICCIQSEGEVEMALVAGATHLGLVASMPSGPAPIPDEQIASLVRVLPTHATPGLLTSRTHPEQIIQHVRSTGARAVQIVQEVPVAVRNAVRGALRGVDILQVVHIIGPESTCAPASGTRTDGCRARCSGASSAPWASPERGTPARGACAEPL
ncbi:MAG: hypothetical protein VX815_03880 [Gemmatimonadota bacterium]|nr:hypothetical protein [Gemmatimonadota bacterium]